MPLRQVLAGQRLGEAATGYRHGFWGLVAKGATFASTGRRRTKPGRAVIAEHRDELVAYWYSRLRPAAAISGALRSKSPHRHGCPAGEGAPTAGPGAASVPAPATTYG